jgi:hypothetical protein
MISSRAITAAVIESTIFKGARNMFIVMKRSNGKTSESKIPVIPNIKRSLSLKPDIPVSTSGIKNIANNIL